MKSFFSLPLVRSLISACSCSSQRSRQPSPCCLPPLLGLAFSAQRAVHISPTLHWHSRPSTRWVKAYSAQPVGHCKLVGHCFLMLPFSSKQHQPFTPSQLMHVAVSLPLKQIAFSDEE